MRLGAWFGVSVGVLLLSGCLSEKTQTATGQGALKNDAAVPGVDWKLIGPGMGGNSFWLTVDPNNDQVLYYSPDVGGLYKSVDGGKIWRKIAADFLHDNRGSVTCLTTVAPSNSNIVYSAGPLRYCDYKGGVRFNMDKAEEKVLAEKYGTVECGLFKSGDAGETWVPIQGPVPRLGAVTVDPEDENTVWAAGPGFSTWSVTYSPTYSGLGEGVVSRTSDGGKSWRHAYAGCRNKEEGAARKVAFGAIVVDPSSPKGNRTLYISGTQGVCKSVDGGATWAEKNNGLPHVKAEQMALFHDEKGKRVTLYVSLSKDGEKAGGVFKSDDGGETWENASGKLDPAFGYRKVTADPRKKDVLYVAQIHPGKGIFKTTDGGKNWQRITYAWGSERNKEMDLWNLSDGYGDRLESEIAISKQNPDRIYYADGACSMYKTENGGKSWTQMYTNKIGEKRFQTRGMDNTFIMGIAASPKDPKKIYMAEHDFGMLSSFDGGVSWENAAATGVNKACVLEQPRGCGTYSVAVDPGNPDFVCAGIKGWANESDNGLFCVSKDGGRTWGKPDNPAGAQQGELPSFVTDVKQKQYYNRCIYSIAILESGRILITKRTGLFYSDDRGSSWKKAETGLAVDSDYMLYRVYPSKKVVGRVFAVCSLFPQGQAGIPQLGNKTDDRVGSMCGGLYVSDDAGVHWRKLNENLEWANPVDFACAGDERVMYLGLKTWVDGLKNKDTAQLYPGGLYKSVDGGKTWQEIIKCRNRLEAGCVAVAVNYKYPSVVYAIVKDALDREPLCAIYRSVDGGAKWRDVSGLASHYNYHCLIVSPTDPAVIYTGTSGSGAYQGVDQYVEKLVQECK